MSGCKFSQRSYSLIKKTWKFWLVTGKHRNMLIQLERTQNFVDINWKEITEKLKICIVHMTHDI